MPLASGTHIGPYEIVAPIGAGGMGEVYRARDTKLNRDIALKILPDMFAGDADRLARFTREAQTLAALNDTHIAHIHGLEESSGIRALAMEFVDGEDLAQRLTRGPIPLDEALALAKQIVEGLEVAHEQGIVHRDLKPANIKVTPDGVVKILDFGLAKAIDPAASSPSAAALSYSPTITSPAAMTMAGMIIGTAAYMAPEQAKGRPVDKRADVWAFGCVLFEMLTGRRAFEGEDMTDTIAAIVRGEPAWDALPRDTPDQIKLLLKRCLEKDRRARIGDVSTIRFLLNETLVAPSAATPAVAAAPASTPHRARTPLAAILGLTAGVLIAVGAVAYIKLNEKAPHPVRFSIAPTTPPLLTDFPDRDVTITPDGTQIIYRAGATVLQDQMVVRSIDQLDGRVMQGVPAFVEPFVSPDGKWIGFFSQKGIQKISIAGGPTTFLCDYNGSPLGASWGDDDTIVFGTSDTTTGLMEVPAAGGTPKALSKTEAGHDDVLPFVLPGSRAVLFTVVTSGGTGAQQIGMLDRKTGQRKILIANGSHPQYLESGHILYTADGVLRVVGFDAKKLELIGDPVPAVEQVMTSVTGEANAVVSHSGTLVYVPGRAGVTRQGEARTLAWISRQGKEEPIKAPPRSYVYPRISPDGTKVALDVRDQENDIWVWDLARETLTRLTFDKGLDRLPIWFPDGKRVAYSSEQGGPPNLYVRAADGTGVPDRLTNSKNAHFPTSISPDGKLLVFREDPPNGRDLMLLALEGKSTPNALINTVYNEDNGEISPDGKWLAYQSNESGQDQVYVRPFPNVNNGRWQVSPGGGSRPVWARSGKELFYLNAMGLLTVVPVKPDGATFLAGNPTQLSDKRFSIANNGRTYDVSPDGQRFLVIKDAAAQPQDSKTPPASMVVVVNWLEELKAKLPHK